MRCILHIGTEKTATTLIQNWLYSNYENLSAQGVALTRVSGQTNNRKLVSYFQFGFDEYLTNNGIYDDHEKSIFFEKFEEEFSNEIIRLRNDHSSVVFTSEHFHSRLKTTDEIKNLKNFLNKFFDEYIIVCYFREQSKLRTSLYSTALKIGGGFDIENFHKGINTSHHYYNYLDFFKKWEEVFGKDALKPRIFLKEYLSDGDIRKDFLSTALPEIDAGKLDYEIESDNESLSRDEAILFREINTIRSCFVGDYRDPTPSIIKNVVRNLDFLDFKTSILDPRQNEMYDMFNDVNIQFFSRYFGEERNLFPRPAKVDEKGDSRSAFDIHDLAKFLGGILSVNNLVAITQEEVNFLRDLAIRLHSGGLISKNEAITLLKLANRARPKGTEILSKIDELRKEK